MSSRALAAARAKRAGEQAPPVSGNRPITSIGSQAAFANMPPPPNNVRVARSMQPMQQNINQQQQQQMRQQSYPPQYNQFQQQQQTSYQSTQLQNLSQHNSTNSNGLPFSKLSISDAIGLITLRLGRVEQWIIETDHENNSTNKSNVNNNIPDNHKIIDNSVLSTIISRIDSLEKNSITNNINNNENVNLEQFNKLTEDIKILNEQFKKMNDDINKHTIEISKNTEQVFKFNRELTETKDILKSFMIKYDQFAEETKNNFNDFENALTELENKVVTETNNNEISSDISEDKSHNMDSIYENDMQDTSIMSVDLKNIIKQEFANI